MLKTLNLNILALDNAIDPESNLFNEIISEEMFSKYFLPEGLNDVLTNLQTNFRFYMLMLVV